MPTTVTISTLSLTHEAAARQLADELQLPLAPPSTADHYQLLLTDSGLTLSAPAPQSLSLRIDFTTPALRYRQQKVSLRKEMLARACGLKQRKSCRIVDATAGLGEDSFILAALGFPVILLERSPIIHALLRDGLARGNEDSTLTATLQRIQLIHADARLWLNEQPSASQPDIIYLDPMFPPRNKKALVKKKMQILQALLGPTSSDDIEELFKTSLACAKERVVVKRPQHAEQLLGLAPTFSLIGRSCRFDVFMVG